MNMLRRIVDGVDRLTSFSIGGTNAVGVRLNTGKTVRQVPIAPVVLRLLDYLKHREEPGYLRSDEYPTMCALLTEDRHPAAVLADLHSGLLTFTVDEHCDHRSTARVYQTILSYLNRQLPDDRWELGKQAYLDVLAVCLHLAAWVRIDVADSGSFLNAIIRRTVATGDDKGRELIRDLIDDIVSSEPNQTAMILDEADRWRQLAGFTRADIPFLRRADAKGALLMTRREALFADAGEPLGPVLRQMLDHEIPKNGKYNGITAEADALLGSSKEQRGRALAFLLDKVALSRDPHGLAQLARRDGRWTHEYGQRDAPKPAWDKLAFELAKRAHVLADPDRTHEKLIALLAAQPMNYGYPETSRLILKQLLTTVGTHPHGATAKALLELPKDWRFGKWGAEIAKGMREAREAASSDNAILPPRELPRFDIGAYADLNRFKDYCNDLFDARLYCEVHDKHIRLLAEFGNVVAQMQSAGRDPTDIGPHIVSELKKAGIAVAVGSGVVPRNFLYNSQEFFAAAMDAFELRQAVRSVMTTDTDHYKELVPLVEQIARKTVPSGKWIAAARAFASKSPNDLWFRRLQQITAVELRSNSSTNGESYIRTLVYISSFLPPEDVGPLLVQYALKKCYVTKAGVGIRSEKIGNACLWALAALPNGAGVPYLARILARTKYPKIRQKIDQQLNQAAAAAGVARADLDELTVPTHDLDRDGRRVIAFDQGTATLVVEGSKAHIEWANADGKHVKSATAAIREERLLLKDAQNDLKELQADLSIQPQRLQKLYVQDRSWPADDWRERFLDQPLMRGFTRRLIWQVEQAGAAPVPAFPDPAGNALLTLSGQPIDLAGSTIRLWHPMHSPVEEVEAWRNRLEALGVVQPFAQAWREVYSLTDAERATATYSNRWAAHILKQQQAMTLARLNGWTVTARVWFDVANDDPWHLHIPAHGLVAQYWVEGAGGDDPETTEAGAYSYINTDRVTFFRAMDGATDSARGPAVGDPLPLDTIPPVLFSEVMRTCDLFTAVASIAADPTWLDRGQGVRHPSQWGDAAERYWHQTNTGELVESGKQRHAMLARIIPRLAIADKLSLTDKALEVKGTRHIYQIHLGSGACSRSGRHICIVPKSNVATSPVRLPFEGDRTLSIILSKAILLASDDRIADPVILAQI